VFERVRDVYLTTTTTPSGRFGKGWEERVRISRRSDAEVNSFIVKAV
jgi:hypothetical protein